MKPTRYKGVILMRKMGGRSSVKIDRVEKLHTLQWNYTMWMHCNHALILYFAVDLFSLRSQIMMKIEYFIKQLKMFSELGPWSNWLKNEGDIYA